MAVPCLPDDLIRTKIMKRLPVECLIRFRSVCKSWNSFILETYFIKDYLDFMTTRNPKDESLIVTRDVVDDSVHFSDLAILALSDLSETRLLHVPYSGYTLPGIDLVGSINGLVCVSLDNLDHFIIWNPAIKQAMKIDSPARQLMSCPIYRSFFGFCWDAKEKDYKVVMSYHMDYYKRLSLYVYSCNLGSWSLPINSTFLYGWGCGSVAPSAIVNGVPYWRYSWHGVGNQCLIKFDFESKDFRKLPELFVGREDYVTFVNLEECLCALAYEAQSSHNLVDIHRFDERDGFWMKMYSVGPITGDVSWKMCNGGGKLYFGEVPFSYETPLGCFKYSGEIVFSAKSAIGGYYTTRCYNHKTKKVTDLHNQNGYVEKCFSYKASLVFHEGMKPQHEVEPTLWN